MNGWEPIDMLDEDIILTDGYGRKVCIYCNATADVTCMLCENPVCWDDAVRQGPWHICVECMGIRGGLA